MTEINIFIVNKQNISVKIHANGIGASADMSHAIVSPYRILY